MERVFKWISEYKVYFYLIVVVVIAFSFLLNVLFTIQLKYENVRLNEEIFELENRIKSVNLELEKSQTDIYIQKEASERLGLVGSDELPVKINVVEREEVEKDFNEDEIKDMKLQVFIQEWYKDIKNIANENTD